MTSKRTAAATAASSDLPKLASPAQRALQGAGITTLADLAKWSEKEFTALHGIGPNATKQLKEAMREKGLSFSRK